MANGTDVRPQADEQTGGSDHGTGACHHAAHLSHDAHVLKSRVEDAIEDAAHSAKRAFKSARRRAQEVGDLKDEALHRIRRQPAQAVGAAFGLGAALGLAIGWFAVGARRRE